MSHLVALLSDREVDQALSGSICTSLQCSLIKLKTPRETADFIKNNTPTAVFIDASTEALYRAFEDALSQEVGLFSEQVNPNFLHFLSDDDLHTAPYLAQSPIFGNFIVRSSLDQAGFSALYSRLLLAMSNAPQTSLKSAFEKICKVQSININQISQKSKAIDAVKAYLVSAKWNMRGTQRLLASLDELLMNAFYDAPHSIGLPTQATFPSLDLAKLEQSTKVKMDLAFDGNYFAISVTDYHGSLDKGRLLKHISKSFSKNEYRVKTTAFNAGIGLSQVHQTGGSLMFIAEPNVKTEVILFVRKTDRFKDSRKQFKFISTQFHF